MPDINVGGRWSAQRSSRDEAWSRTSAPAGSVRGLPDEGAGVARTALQAGYGVAEAGTVPGRQPPSGDTERQSQYTARTAPCRPVAG
jgi:hypothetical protein